MMTSDKTLTKKRRHREDVGGTVECPSGGRHGRACWSGTALNATLLNANIRGSE